MLKISRIYSRIESVIGDLKAVLMLLAAVGAVLVFILRLVFVHDANCGDSSIDFPDLEHCSQELTGVDLDNFLNRQTGRFVSHSGERGLIHSVQIDLMVADAEEYTLGVTVRDWGREVNYVQGFVDCIEHFQRREDAERILSYLDDIGEDAKIVFSGFVSSISSRSLSLRNCRITER